MRISLGAIIIAIAAVVWGKQWLVSEVRRGPASFDSNGGVAVVETIESEDKLPSSVRRETFRFKRIINADLVESSGKVASTRSFAKVEYEGTFYLEWISRPSADERRALVGFEINSGKKRAIKSSIPFVVQFKKDWVLDHVETLATRTDDEEDTVNILKDFATIYAFRTEQDTAGAFEASFNDKPNETIYSKLRYRENGSPGLKSIVIEESHHEVRFDLKDKSLARIQGLERTSLKASSSSKLVTFSKYELTRVKQSYAKRTPISSIHLVQTPLQLKVNAWVEAPKWEKVYAGLEQIVQLKKPERMGLFHDVVKNLKKDQTHLNDFKNWVESSAHRSGVLHFGIGVLATAGSDEAQKILMEWFNQYPEARNTILNSLSMAEAPLSAETQSTVLALVDQKHDPGLAYNAALTLGSDLRKSDELSDSVDAVVASRKNVEAKLAKLYEEASPQDQLIYLDAMGNSGSVAFVSIIDRNLASNDISIREKSAYAARFMRTAVARELILKALSDQSTRVRLSAVKAIAYQRDLSVYREALAQYAKGDDEISKMSKQLLDAHSDQSQNER